jgi:Ca2+-binding EF-hand superfamily protein
MISRRTLLGGLALLAVSFAVGLPGTAEAKAKAKAKKHKGIDALAVAFEKFDANHDGQLSPAEFKAYLKSRPHKHHKKPANVVNAGAVKPHKKHHHHHNQAKALFKKLDTNHDGSLSLVEFEQLKHHHHHKHKKKVA